MARRGLYQFATKLGSYFSCFLVVGVLLCLFRCTPSSNKEIEGKIVTDDLGRNVKLKTTTLRLLPFAPSVTEMLACIVDTARLIGRTPYCNFPASSKFKPAVQNYPPDMERILSLHPDLLITKDGMLSLPQAAAIEKMGIPVYFQTYNSVEDIFEKLKSLGELIGAKDRGSLVADSLKSMLSNISKKNATLNRPTVLVLISKDNLYAYGKESYASDMVLHAGGVNVLDTKFSTPFPMLSAEYVLSLNPDVLIGGETVGLDKDFFTFHPELKRTTAYKKKQCYTINEDLLSRPGPRAVETIQRIQEYLNKVK